MSSPILFLHGAGSSDKNRTKYLQDLLTQKGIKSNSFNFTGAGGDKNELSQSSLKRRFEEAKNTVEDFRLKEPLTLAGSSMGGYIAIKLLEIYKIENLILFCPGIYTPEAFEVPFTDKFSTIIRRRDSWKSSDAFKVLNDFKGKVLLVIGEQDEVIPKELVNLIDHSLVNVAYKEIVQIPNCPHTIHQWLSQNEEWSHIVAEKIARLLK